VTSCTRDEQEHEYSYLVSKEYKSQLGMTYCKNMIDFISVSIPEISNLKPFIESNVNVYKIV
jgi:hypothetical protein